MKNSDELITKKDKDEKEKIQEFFEKEKLVKDSNPLALFLTVVILFLLGIMNILLEGIS
ncbi:hypothetical protein [Frisingicoccus sp.]|uniref:hypothetical protein n=1 Tax=Frisingicoccus sp. TaxID=1918627 RepID=UPI00386991F8